MPESGNLRELHLIPGMAAWLRAGEMGVKGRQLVSLKMGKCRERRKGKSTPWPN